MAGMSFFRNATSLGSPVPSDRDTLLSPKYAMNSVCLVNTKAYWDWEQVFVP